MTSRGFRSGAADRIADVLSRSVNDGRMPGAVFGVSRRGETHVQSVGTVAVGGPSMPPDALFRITSMTRPITAFAALILADRGLIALAEPVDDMLPELADPRVLRRPDGPLVDTVAPERSITTRDLLTMRGGFGMILAPPDEYPILQAEADLGLRSVGPPFPATVHPPDEWIRRMGTLPLMDQPGRQWRYCTGSMILGVLVARAAGQALESFYDDAIFEPLGMRDSTFFAAPDDPRVVPPCYQRVDGSLVAFDDGETWRHRRPFPDGGAGLLSTVGDYLRFGTTLLANGAHDGEQLLSRDLVARMTTDQLTADQRAAAGPILDNRGWGFGLSIVCAPEGKRGPKGYGWSGGFGTVWLNDPDEDLSAVLCTQVLLSEASYALEADFWDAVYGTLDD
jgi:CubicO group peptidase (beta-lactamase class C family)